MNVKYSIIVPIYNVSSYLEKCIESVLGQTYINFECILVDDGSTDKSGEIADKYAKSDDRLKVIHKENGGLSSARNAGLQVASGKWIMHLDSDDYIEPNTLEKVEDYLGKYDVDLVRFEYVAEYPNGKAVSHRIDRAEYYGVVSGELVIERILRDCSYLVCGVCKADIQKKISLREDIRYGADLIYNLELADRINKVLYIPDVLYHYYQGMIGMSKAKVSATQISVLDTVDWVYEYLLKNHPKFTEYGIDECVNSRVNLYYKMYMSHYQDDRLKKQIVKDMYEKYNIMKKKHRISLKKRIKYSVFEINPDLYCKLFEIVVNMIPGEKYAMYKTR